MQVRDLPNPPDDLGMQSEENEIHGGLNDLAQEYRTELLEAAAKLIRIST